MDDVQDFFLEGMKMIQIGCLYFQNQKKIFTNLDSHNVVMCSSALIMVRSCNLIYNLHWRSGGKFSPVALIYLFFLFMSSKSLLVAHDQMICGKWINETLACFIMAAERLNLLHIAEDIWVCPILIHHGENWGALCGMVSLYCVGAIL